MGSSPLVSTTEKQFSNEDCFFIFQITVSYFCIFLRFSISCYILLSVFCAPCQNRHNPVSYTHLPERINAMHLPGGPGVRMDTAAYQGYMIPPFYDSMIGKLIVSGEDRTQAIARMRRALAETLFDGVTTLSLIHI